VHLALLDRADLFQDLYGAMASMKAQQEECSSMVLISGPSRTADIEMTLTIGVHGPRQVHVICYS
jgi:L-lactate dehydrogenase complex protein LldG